MKGVLLTVSGNIPANLSDHVGRGLRPETDYQALERVLPADLLDYSAARRSAGPFQRLLERAGGPNLALAWACFRRRNSYRVILTDGEQVGIPLAVLFKLAGRDRPRHMMIGHILSVPKKMVFFDLLSVQNQIDLFVVYSSWQKQFIESRWGVAESRVARSPFMVNSRFFSPQQVNHGLNPYTAEFGDRMICAVGLEFRDYPTLIQAVRGLDAQVVIAAASPWSKRADSTRGQALPPNVTVRRFTQYELRQLYAASRFLVMPLYEVNFQAGVTALLEAMAMEKAVICSRTAGQSDVVVDGQAGFYVPPGDPSALRGAIERLLANPLEARRMGQNGRALVEQEMSLDCYAQRIKQYLKKLLL